MQPFAKSDWADDDKIVIGIDIGTTHTAVSYAHLYTGGPQVLTRVGKWPGQPDQRVISKIPSVIYYNNKEEPVRCGAEATTFDAKAEANENNWQLAKHFKLHLHPKNLRTEHKLKMEALPFTLTVDRIYADLLKYLMVHTKSFFESRTADGARTWSELGGKSDIVMSHPNGWGLQEQSILRRAAVMAEIVTEADAGTRVRFVSEGEASVHFCLLHGNISTKLESETKFLVCDAGGSTVDTTAYVVKKREPSLVLEEAKASGCVQAGGIYVNQETMWQLRAMFSTVGIPRLVMEEWLRNADEDFENNLKPDFPRAGGRYSITLDRASYQNRALGIKNGRLQLPHEAIAMFFERCVKQIQNAIQQQLVNFDAKHILLVGGFGESKYLQQVLRGAFSSKTCDLTVIDDGTSKAVSDGAVIWNCTRQVNARIARFSYGTTIHPIYNPSDPGHANRPTYQRADGTTRVRNGWKGLVLQGALLKEDTTQSIFYDFPSLEAAKSGLKTVRQFIYSHPNFPDAKTFVRDSEGNLGPDFVCVCEIKADLSDLVDSLVPIEGKEGKGTFYKVYFKIRITFGDTELKAYIEWQAEGERKRGPATVIPNHAVMQQ